MSTERAVLRRAAQLVALAEGLRQDGLGAAFADEAPRPTSWPADRRRSGARVGRAARLRTRLLRPDRPGDRAGRMAAALRDMEHRMELWIKRFTCGVAGRGHDTTPRGFAAPHGWADFVDRDVTRRQSLTGAADT